MASLVIIILITKFVTDNSRMEKQYEKSFGTKYSRMDQVKSVEDNL